MMKQIYFLTLTLVLASCSSSLKIRVDVLNREALRKFPEFRKMEAEQAYSKLKALESRNSFNDYKEELRKITRAGIENFQKGVIAKDNVQTLIDNIDKGIN